jgi:flagellar basal-body rod protein FlgG
VTEDRLQRTDCEQRKSIIGEGNGVQQIIERTPEASESPKFFCCYLKPVNCNLYFKRSSMIRALYTAASGMTAEQMNLDTIANNLANASTTGFRQLRLEFQDMVYQNLVTPGAAQSQSTVSAGLQIGLGTKSAATEVIMTQGSLNQTSNPLDVAIEGAGFFQIQRPDGTIAYTRAGQFQLNNQGTLVTTDGDPVIPTITIPANATAVTITQYGVVDATLAGQQNPSQLGQLQLATFPNAGGLESMGSNLLTSTLSSGNPVLGNPGGTEGLGTLQQGYLENSNVDVVTMFVQMVLAQRAYESNTKVVTAADNMYQQVNNMAH